jgi:hypothetical protein
VGEDDLGALHHVLLLKVIIISLGEKYFIFAGIIRLKPIKHERLVPIL